jgi:hypothetical protein
MKKRNPLKTVGLIALALCIAGIVFAAWKVQSFYNRIYKNSRWQRAAKLTAR